LEAGLIVGALLIVAGLAGSVWAVKIWAALHFGKLEGDQVFRVIIPAATAVTLGVETVLCSFFLSVLGLRRR
jgi:hypothetical protein